MRFKRISSLFLDEAFAYVKNSISSEPIIILSPGTRSSLSTALQLRLHKGRERWRAGREGKGKGGGERKEAVAEHWAKGTGRRGAGRGAVVGQKSSK